MRLWLLTIVVLGLAGLAAAQQKPAPAAQTPSTAAPQPAAAAAAPAQPLLEPAATPVAGAPGASGSPPAAVPPPPTNYSYDPAGRRDPFLSLLGTGTDPRVTTKRPDGVGGLMVNELAVRGIMRSRGALVAAVQGPDKRTYLVRQGDKLLDGTVRAVTPEGLTIVQDVNDPLSIVKQREVQKLLRSFEDAK